MDDCATSTDWIRLVTTPGLGGRTLRRLVDQFDGPEAAIRATNEQLAAAGVGRRERDAIRSPDPDRIARTVDWLQDQRNSLLTGFDSDYPPLLADIPDPPAVLYVHGDPLSLWSPQVAVVGSRNPTGSGKDLAAHFARGLVTAGVTITSGLALGIDAEAHREALDAGGKTIAVMGTGLDQVYPARNRDLAHAIAANGALVSEFALDTPARAGHFPMRNRIISGLSLGTLVIEAALRSGSLITARLAAEQGREIFAVPGSIHNALARGCHRLIRDGATLVEGPSDVVQQIAPLALELGAKIRTRLEVGDQVGDPVTTLAPGGTGPSRESDPDYANLLAALGHDPVSPDSLVSTTGLTTDVVSSMLLLLELEGYVQPCPGGRYSLAPGPSEKACQ